MAGISAGSTIRAWFALLLCFGCLGGIFTGSASAAEAPPELLWQVPVDAQPGTGAERMIIPRGLAANPTTGNVLVADYGSARIAEFTVWGGFVRAWGFGVDDGAAELQECTTATGCQAGLAGSAPGQLFEPGGIAVDAAGSVYVYEFGNNRVTKYSEEGEFLLMFGGNVNQTTGAEVCTAADVAANDTCGAGATGTGPGFFENPTLGNYIDVSPSGTIFVGDKGRIQEFNPDGSFKGEIPFTGELADLAGDSVFNLAIDPVSGDLYFDTNDEESLYRISATGELQGTSAVGDLPGRVIDEATVNGAPKVFPDSPAALAVDSEGNLWVVDHPPGVGFGGPFEVLKFSPTGECLICGKKLAQQDTKTLLGRSLMGLATNDACDIPESDLYVTVFNGAPQSPAAYVQSYGQPPQDIVNCPPPKAAPEITDQYAVSVGIDDAEVQAKINTNFWNDTRYYVEYGPQACLDSGWTTGCSTAPLPPGPTLTSQVLNRPVPTDDVLLDSLLADTTYHFRFVAQSSGSDGAPVFGPAASFRTFPETLPPGPCGNQTFRTGLSAFLPDCRAYEMVSPVDKNGGDILTQASIRDYTVELNVSSVDGNQVTYSSEAAFANSVSAPYASQYIAKRDKDNGWETEAISPPREKLFRPAGKAPLYELDNQYKLFSPELGVAWLMQEADPPLDEQCGVPGYINWYKRDNATGGYEAITTKTPPTGKDPLLYMSEVQGYGVDGEGRTHTIYRANDKLPVDSGPAAADGIAAKYQLYEHISGGPNPCGETRLVSVLPGESTNTTASSVGTAAFGTSDALWIEARENLVHNAVSADGSVIYWTAAGEGPGKIYARVGGAVTREVSTAPARFWQAADNGTIAYYIQGEALFRYTLSNQTRTQLAPQTIGLVGASEDGTRVYFVSKADLDGVGNATAGQPNLYLRVGSTTTFIATLSERDVSINLLLSPASAAPVARTASVSADGRFLAFTSDAALTGSDNIDAKSGLPDTEAFYFEADSGELRCVSCSFTGAKPSGRVISGVNNAQQGYAARIPPWKNQFHAPRVISEDGSTVYFESLERLVPRDTNGTQDVYQWYRAVDQAGCEAQGAELFNPEVGGCISLISSGTGTGDATFVDSTPDGSDVFFRTPASLVSQDPGRIDLYDARRDGGFPPPPPPPEPCSNPAGCPPIPPPPSVTPPNSKDGTPNPSLEECKPLQRKAQKLAAKARKLRRKAAKAQGQEARALRKKAKKQSKKANKASARAQACFTGVGGK